MLAVADLDARVGERRAGGGGDRRGRCDVAEDEVAPGEVAISNNLTIGPELALRVEVDDARVVEAVTRGLVAMHRLPSAQPPCSGPQRDTIAVCGATLARGRPYSYATARRSFSTRRTMSRVSRGPPW